MEKSYEGLPAALNVEQSIILAQLQILRNLERAAANIARTFIAGAEANSEVVLIGRRKS